ncbi:hypothetical protein ACFOLA_04435 [Salinicoccus hispanicus]|uniref:Uncharacterized protein n=1 Tax=Salinicoccus hispanicus TaxID=157225 RepID=A0A6N8U2U3_9STAP|nr:hypothetical protein [Salinicoccus hispanicus]MXQ52063.1 hypothetical protein [Salinicoccus hispanicus]
MKNKKKSANLAAIVLTGAILGGCSNPFDAIADVINSVISEDTEDVASEPADTAETTDSDTSGIVEETTTEESITDDNVTEAPETETDEVETLDYSHLMNQGEATTLGEGTFTVGEDIPIGRYRATVTEGYGNLFIYDEAERMTLSATMSEVSDDSNQSRPGEVVIFLDEGHELEITGIDDVDFTPYETDEVTELSPGQWVVGEDFPAGLYDISLEESETLGYLKVNVIKDYEKSRFALGSLAYGGTTEFTTAFETGEVITIEWVPKVVLTER